MAVVRKANEDFALMLRWWLGFAFASVTASTVLGCTYWVQQTVEGPSETMNDLRGIGQLLDYVAVTGVLALLPVALVGSLTDSALQRLGRQELWAYALAGLVGGALIGWFLATFTPQSEDDGGGSVAPIVWQLALFGVTASSAFWWAVRRQS